MSAEGMKRPIQIEEFRLAINEMSQEELTGIRHEIENNIRHLNKTNDTLLEYVDKIEGKVASDRVYELNDMDELDKFESSDLQLFKDSLLENQIVLRNCNDRIEALDEEKIYRESGSYDNTKRSENAQESNKPNSIYL